MSLYKGITSYISPNLLSGAKHRQYKIVGAFWFTRWMCTEFLLIPIQQVVELLWNLLPLGAGFPLTLWMNLIARGLNSRNIPSPSR